MPWNLALSNLRPLDLGLTKNVAQMSHRKGEGHFNFYRVVWVLNSPWKDITWVSFRRIFKYSNGWVDYLKIILKFPVYVQIVEFKIERGSIKVQIVENKESMRIMRLLRLNMPKPGIHRRLLPRSCRSEPVRNF